MQREARLAAAAGADQADQPRARQQLGDIRRLSLSPDEAGERDWQAHTKSRLRVRAAVGLIQGGLTSEQIYRHLYALCLARSRVEQRGTRRWGW